MTDPREERLREGYEAMNAGDYERAAANLHPDAEWTDAPELVGGGHHRGRDAIVAFWGSYGEAFSEWRMEMKELEHIDERRTLVTVRMIHTGRESGIPLEFDLFMLWTFDEGRARRIEVRLSRDQLQFS